MEQETRLSGFLRSLRRFFPHIDFPMFLSVLPMVGAGLITMNSLRSENYFFEKQLISVGVAILLFFIFSAVDFHFLRGRRVIVALFGGVCLLLTALLLFGDIVKGARAWFDFGFFSFQPADVAKLVLVILLAKYFTRRHIEIAHVRHILVSGIYALILFGLVFLQPDFGSAVIIFLIWLGMLLVAGISWRHLAMVFLFGITAFAIFWFAIFADYQKERIVSFISPRADIMGSGYNAFQSVISIGSGGLTGKGVGFGTQSRLKFLPEYQTDFVFSAFAEEWGLVGILILFFCYGFFIFRLLRHTVFGETNFEMLFTLGLAIFFISHFIINVGMNIGLLPITGTPFPFMSYGGTHVLVEFAGLGILMGIRRHSARLHKAEMKNEFLGI